MKDFRLILDRPRGGPENMALDEAHFISAAETGAPTLRLYAFEPPAVTVGRFQDPASFLHRGRCESEGVQVVRRPTGGLAILHSHDLTYGFTAPLEGGREGARDTYFEMVSLGLRLLGIDAARAEHGDPGNRGGWCFAGEYGVDLSWRSRKICGSAQRIGADSVLQHGTVFLADGGDLMKRISTDEAALTQASTFVALPEAAGRGLAFEEVADGVRQGFEDALGIRFEEAEVGEKESRMAESLLASRYAEGPWGPAPVS